MIKNITTKSHSFTEADIDLLPLLDKQVKVGQIFSEPLSIRASAIVFLAEREEAWVKEDESARLENRKPRHPRQIRSLYAWTVFQLIEEQKFCGMTNTHFYRDSDGALFSLNSIAYLDENRGDIDCDDLIATIEAPEFDFDSFPKSRTAILSKEMEDKLDALRDGTSELSQKLSESGKGVTQRRAQQIIKKECEVAAIQSDFLTFENIADSMLNLVGEVFVSQPSVQKKTPQIVVKKCRKIVKDERQLQLIA